LVVDVEGIALGLAVDGDGALDRVQRIEDTSDVDDVVAGAGVDGQGPRRAEDVYRVGPAAAVDDRAGRCADGVADPERVVSASAPDRQYAQVEGAVEDESRRRYQAEYRALPHFGVGADCYCATRGVSLVVQVDRAEAAGVENPQHGLDRLHAVV